MSSYWEKPKLGKESRSNSWTSQHHQPGRCSSWWVFMSQQRSCCCFLLAEKMWLQEKCFGSSSISSLTADPCFWSAGQKDEQEENHDSHRGRDALIGVAVLVAAAAAISWRKIKNGAECAEEHQMKELPWSNLTSLVLGNCWDLSYFFHQILKMSHCLLKRCVKHQII